MTDAQKKTLIAVIHALNIGAVATQLAQVFPENKWILMANVVISAVLPSLGGVGHAVAFGGSQESAPPPSTKP
jgi:hypothetical protein